MGELLGLTRADVDLLHRRVYVTKQLQELSTSGIVMRPPKTDAGTRPVEIPKVLVPLIEQHLDTWVGSSTDAPLFTGPKGGQRRSTI
jgi:integrase